MEREEAGVETVGEAARRAAMVASVEVATDWAVRGPCSSCQFAREP